MKKTACLLVFVLALFMAAQSYASIQLNTMPSTDFVRSTGEPKTETRTFSGIGGPAIIRLINGDLTDTTIERVSSSIINVNGALVFGSSDFNQNVSALEKDVNLQDGPNTLSVLLKGKPGGAVSIEIIQILDNIKIDPSKILLQEVGTTSQITVTGELSNGTVVDVTDPSRGTIYSSLKSGVVTVSPSGLVTAVADGDTNIVVTNGSFGANIPVKVQITQSTRTVGQDGGTLIFHNGLVLEIPPGAVSESTTILIKDLPLDQVTAIVTNPLLSSDRTKRFLGGFAAEPDGLVFNEPVLATIPVLPLNPREIPAQIEIFLSEQRYRYVTSQFTYLGDQGVVKVYIQHFSDPTIIGLTGPEFEALCTVCPANNAPFPPECNIDPLQLPCCNLYPNVRATCPQASGCSCCREGHIEVVEVSTDFMTNECQLLSSDLKIRFVDCPGSPTESDSVGEMACKDIDLNITIVPDQLTLAVGEQSPEPLKALVKGTWNKGPLQGKVAFSDAPIDPMWISDAPEIADFVGPLGQQGFITGIKSNPEPINVWAKMGESTSNVTYNPAKITVTGDYVEIWPGGDDLCPGEKIILGAILRNYPAEEELPTVDVDWEWSISGDPSTARCDYDPCPSQVKVVITAGPLEGVAQITAHNVKYNLSSAPVYLDVYKDTPKIRVTSYRNGGKAYVTGANLVGTIEECGTRRVKFIQVTNGSYISLLRPVDDDGKFSVMINLNWGINYLTFSTYDANNGNVTNNMDGKYFRLTRLPHCAKVDGNSPTLPTALGETPVTWLSEKPSIATVDAISGDPEHVAVTGHANGWARITADWYGHTLVRWVGVSTGTNYVATHQDDPFYKSEHEMSPAIVQMLWQMYGYEALASDLNNKYFTGFERTLFFPECVPIYGSQPEAGFLYDGTSVQSFFAPTDDLYHFCLSWVQPSAVNEKGQVVGCLGSGFILGDIWEAAFIYDHGVLSLVADPFAYHTYLNDINNMGKAVGSSLSGAGSSWDFIYDVVAKTFTYIASGSMYINDSGQVLGQASSTNGYSLWLYKDGVYETVVGPGAIWDYHFHESGQVYVSYENGHSVLLTRCAPGD